MDRSREAHASGQDAVVLDHAVVAHHGLGEDRHVCSQAALCCQRHVLEKDGVGPDFCGGGHGGRGVDHGPESIQGQPCPSQDLRTPTIGHRAAYAVHESRVGVVSGTLKRAQHRRTGEALA